VYQYDVFFYCLVASCVVKGRERRDWNESDDRVGRRNILNDLCFVDL